jgi:hypothetical protein
MAEKYPFLPLAQQPKVDNIINKTKKYHQTQLYKIIFLATLLNAMGHHQTGLHNTLKEVHISHYENKIISS